MSIAINGKNLYYNSIIYVDEINGNDSNDGSSLHPLQTIEKAVSMVNQDNTAIVFKDGKYLKKYNVSYSSPLIQINYNIDFIAENYGKVYFEGYGSLNSNGNFFQINNSKIVNFYRIIFTDGRDVSTFADCSYMFNGLGTAYINFYDCLFYGKFRINISGKIQFNNCEFYNQGYCLIDSYGTTGNYNIVFTNCIFWKKYGSYGIVTRSNSDVFNIKTSIWGVNNTFVGSSYCLIQPFSVIETNLVYNFSFDYKNNNSVTWQNTGTGNNPDTTQANIGVYGGSFAWGDWILKVIKDYNVLGTYISQLNPDTNYSTATQYLLGGGNQILLKTDFDKNLGYIKNATLNINVASLTTGGEVKIVKLNSDWDINTVTYNTSPIFESSSCSFNITSTGNQTLDITNLMRNVYDNDNNYGIAIYTSVAQMSLNTSVTLTIMYVPTEIIMPTEIHSNGVLVKWKPVKLPVDTKYFYKLRLERGSTPDFTDGAGTVVFETTDINITEYFDTSVQPNINYYYKVFIEMYNYNEVSEITTLTEYDLSGIKKTQYGYMLSGGTVYFS